MNNLRPIGDRLIVKQAEAETTTRSGLIIADTAKEKPQRGTVLAVGEGRLRDDGTPIPMGIEVGDNVIYSKFGGTEVKLDGEDYVILRADDIYAIYDAEEVKDTWRKK
ncbi:MAG: co-chaperone GroES [Actinomycetia bacterium]|nr:co-chaperone GroES [Actinomycetes bacterium]